MLLSSTVDGDGRTVDGIGVSVGEIVTDSWSEGENETANDEVIVTVELNWD